MTNPANDPATDPIGTVRVHWKDNEKRPDARRRIKLPTAHEPGHYWRALTPSMVLPGTPVANDSNMTDWPVQPLDEVARALGHPVPSVPHGDVVTVPVVPIVDEIRTVIGADTADAVEVLLYREALPESVPVEDTDTPDSNRYVVIAFCNDPDGERMAELVGLYDNIPDAREGQLSTYGSTEVFRLVGLDEPVSTVDGTVDSVHERIMRALADVAIVDTPRAADAMLAALPELAENAGLREDVRHAEAAANTQRDLATKWRKTAEGYKSDLAHALGELKERRSAYELSQEVNRLTVELRAQNKAYGRASATIGQLRAELSHSRALRNDLQRSVKQLITANEQLKRPAPELAVGDRVTWTDDYAGQRTGTILATGESVSWHYNDALTIGDDDPFYGEALLRPDDVTKLP